MSSLSFLISSSERIATMTNVAATFSFTTSAGGELYFGSTITLMFSSGLFVASDVPSGVCIVVCYNHSITAPSDGQFVFTVARSSIPANSNVTVTVFGLTLGNVTAGSSSVITISTSADITASDGVSSGVVVGRVKSVQMLINPNHRLASKQLVDITIRFTPYSFIPVGGSVTLNYPVGFFAPNILPLSSNSNDSNVVGLKVHFNMTTETSLRFRSLNTPIGTSPFQLNIKGLSFGAQSFQDTLYDISVQTSSDIYPAFAPAGYLHCPPGSKRNASTPIASCELCPPGSYQPLAAQDMCAECAPGKFCSVSGLSSLSSSCAPGS